MFVFVQRRECQRTNYDSRRTWDGLLDRGSTPLISIENPLISRGFNILYYKGKGVHMKNYKGLLITALIFDGLQIIGSIFGMLIGFFNLITVINESGGIDSYLHDFEGIFHPGGEYWGLYVILVFPFYLITLVLPLFCVMSFFVNIAKIVIGIGVLQNDVMEYEENEKKCKTLFITSVITLNYVSAIMYGITKNKIQQERVYMSMRRNYPLQWRY